MMKIIKLKKCNYEHQGTIEKEYENAYVLSLYTYPLNKNPYESYYIHKNEIEYIKDKE